MGQMSPYEFGGSEKQVRSYQQFFVKYFYQCKNVLDIGCGRGIFLQLLKEKQIPGRGVDVYKPTVQLCREKGLDVVATDVFDYLRTNKETFDGIFCSHVVEHFPYGRVVTLIQMMHDALSKNGTLIIVVPNPESFRVLSTIFWLDPGHVRFYPGLLLSKMLSENGFSIQYLHSIEGYCGLKALIRRMMDSVLALKIVGTDMYVIAQKV